MTLTATVAAREPAAPAMPLAGVVEFRDGANVVGSVPVDGTGSAMLTTTDLAVGRRALTAAYLGDEVFASSVSAPVEHLVAAAPTLSLPDPVAPIVIGGNPRPVNVTVANPADVPQ